jgi:hypothetical protein
MYRAVSVSVFMARDQYKREGLVPASEIEYSVLDFNFDHATAGYYAPQECILIHTYIPVQIMYNNGYTVGHLPQMDAIFSKYRQSHASRRQMKTGGQMCHMTVVHQ